MTEQFTTEGEKMLGRELQKEHRGGIEHYVTGQHKAIIVEEDYAYHAVLGFVNVLGEATMLMCERKIGEGGPGEWRPKGTVMRAGMLVQWGVHPLPSTFALTDLMKDALNVAQREWEEEHGG